MSLPSRERGLKLHKHAHSLLTIQSLPSRERGLKPGALAAAAAAGMVAPLAGAWIETFLLALRPCGLAGRSPRGSVD